MANRTKRTADHKGRFLAILAEGGSVKLAAEKAKIGRRTAYEWREKDAAFAAAWDEAVEAGTDALEDEAVRRACAARTSRFSTRASSAASCAGTATRC